MAIEVKHATQAVGTDAGNGEIAKAQWNEGHDINMATNRLLGRTTADAGPVEEIEVGSGLSLSGGGLDVAATLSDKTMANMVFDGNYTEEVFTITDGGSVDLNPANGTIQLWTLGASRSPTASSFASGQSLTLLIDDGTNYTITWPSVTWKTDGGTAPTLNASGYTVVQLWKVSSVLYGARVGDA